MYEIIRRFIATHLAPINTVILIVGSVLALMKFLGFWTAEKHDTAVESTVPAVSQAIPTNIQPQLEINKLSPVVKVELVEVNKITPAKKEKNPSSNNVTNMAASTTDAPTSHPDAVVLLQRQFDDERLKQTNAVLDTQLK